MNNLLKVLVGVLVLGGGLVLVADRQGWLGEATATVGDCRHELAPASCPFCTPSLIEELGMCPGHGVPEALCTRCNPALIPAFRIENDWCAGHDLPESQCLLCNPELAGPDNAALPPSQVDVVLGPEVPRSQRAPSVVCTTTDLRVQFASEEVAGQAGLEFAEVRRQPVRHTVECNAEVAYDGNRYAHLSSRAAGVLREVPADLGQEVEAGAVLAVVDSAELGSAKAAYLQAQALVSLWERNHEREKSLLERNVGTERELLEAETRLAESRIALSSAAQKLRNLGLDEAALEWVLTEQDTSSLLPLTAPFSGVVVERHAAVGEVVDTTRSLFTVADTDKMWAMLDVYEADMSVVQSGQAVALELQGRRGERAPGRITWVSSHLDPQTRTLKARAEFANPDGRLRAGMFGRAVVIVHDGEEALLVPVQAVQWDGCCNIAFVRRTAVLYEPRKVLLGPQISDHFVVEEGLAAGEPVVTTGSFLLKTEILKGNIGAGCCEVHPGTDR